MQLLQEEEYEPAATETKATSGTHSDSQDVDATNLVITFTPDTTRVLIELEGYCFAGGVAGDNVHVFWNVREGSSDVFAQTRVMRTINPMRCKLTFILTGLTPGVAKTYKWGQKSSSASIAVNLRMGGTGTSAAGPATMRAYSIAEGTEELLALSQHNPDPAVTPQMNSSTYADVDDTDAAFPALTFTPPADGDVDVELEAYAHVGQRWTLREDTTNLSSDGSTDGIQAHGSDNIPGRILLRFGFAGLAGAKTYKWGWRRNATQIQLFYGTDYGVAAMRAWSRSGRRTLGRTVTWPTPNGGHFANQFGGAMEQYGSYTADTASLVAPVQVTFTVPNVAEPLVLVMWSMDCFTNTALTEHGYVGLDDGGGLIAGTRKRVHSGGPNNKRRINYSHVLRGLTPGASVTLTLVWEGTNADDVRANNSNSGLTRTMFEVLDVSAIAADSGSSSAGSSRRRGASRRDRTRGRRAYLQAS